MHERFGLAALGRQDHIGIADNRRQHVVEVVGDAPGEPADSLHLLRLPELLITFPKSSHGHGPLGDVLVDGQHAEDLTAAVAEGDFARAHDASHARRRDRGLLEVEFGLTGFDHRAIVFQARLDREVPGKIFVRQADDGE